MARPATINSRCRNRASEALSDGVQRDTGFFISLKRVIPNFAIDRLGQMGTILTTVKQ